MHILIGIITAVAGLFWALNSVQRSGFDLNAFNPFFWYRRYQWSKKYGIKPLYNLDDPMGAAAVILLAVAKIDGEISKQEKESILQIFLTDFNLSDQQARELLASTSFLIKDEMSLLGQATSILERSLPRFTKEQVDSFLVMLRKIANIEAGSQDKKAALITEVSAVFQKKNQNGSTW